MKVFVKFAVSYFEAVRDGASRATMPRLSRRESSALRARIGVENAVGGVRPDMRTRFFAGDATILPLGVSHDAIIELRDISLIDTLRIF
jgi:hypothetical protein